MYVDKGSVSQRQSAVSERIQNQKRDYALGIQEQTTLGTTEAGKQIDQ
ncbi:hypothetical protein [Nitrosomonas eutropha]|nr:hypothetical protein [Nitrosomonas eutropha]